MMRSFRVCNRMVGVDGIAALVVCAQCCSICKCVFFMLYRFNNRLFPCAVAPLIASPGSLKIDYAISREMNNAQGGKLYVQDIIAQNADEIFHRLNNGANMYFCGLKGMMPPILQTMERVAAERGVDWKEMMARLKENHQWHVEVRTSLFVNFCCSCHVKL